MTARYGQYLRAHSLGCTDFLLRRDRAIVGGDHKPAGLRVPGSLLNRRAQNGALGRTLNRKNKALLCRREVLGKTLANALFRQHQIAVIDLSKLAIGWRSWVLRRHSAEGFAFLGSEGGDVNHSHHFGVVSGFGDDRAAVGMPDEKYRTILRIDQAIGGGNVIGDGA